MTQTRPNILFITTDQQRADHLGLEGLQAIDTPNLGRLGREGIHYRRAYTPMPTCTPARVSWITGTWPSRHGSYSIGVTHERWGVPTVAEQFAGAGYATALIGKTHFVRRADEATHINPGGDWKSFTGPYCGFEHVRVSLGHTSQNAPNMHYAQWLADHGQDPTPWFPKLRGENLGVADMIGRWNIPAEFTDTAWVGDETEAFIEAQSGDKPWFCMANFQDPHTPFMCPEPWFSKVDTGKMQLFPGPREDEFADKPPFYQQVWDCYDGDRWSKSYEGLEDIGPNGQTIPPPCAFTEAKYDKDAAAAMQATLGMVAHIDHRVGRVLDALERTGQLDNTIVVFTSDHGEYHGHHGLWGKGLPAYEDCQRVPCLVWAPQLIRQRGTTQHLLNTAELPLSFLRLCGIAPAPGMQGHDHSRFWLGADDNGQEATIIENRATESSIYQTTLVTQSHKLVTYRDDEDWEMYDLDNDPDQLVNLWRQPDQEATKRELLAALARTHMRLQSCVAPRNAFA